MKSVHTMSRPAAAYSRLARYGLYAGLLASLGLLAAACGGGNGGEQAGTVTGASGATAAEAGEIVPVAVNSELVLGPNRFALGLMDEEKRPILEAPGTSVHYRFFYGDDLKDEQDAAFVPATPDVSGFFAAVVDFDEVGEWKAEITVTRDGEKEIVPYVFSVQAESEIPNVGDPVPATKNLTLAVVPDVMRISTDPEPEPAFYEMTVAEALDTGRPTVVIFATPAFCRTEFCGPIVDNAKEVHREFADRVNFIHIEPFVLDTLGQLVTDEQGAPIFTDAAKEWRIQTEPWVFVVGADGRIVVRFEGAVTPAELREAIERALA